VHAETVAYVTAQVKAALGNVNNYVLRDDQVQTGSGGNSATNWTDPRTSNDYEILNDSSGKSIAWLSTYLVHRVLTWKVIQADYSTRTWFIDVFHAAGPIQGSTAGATSNVMTPAQIKSWLDSGRLKITGHQVSTAITPSACAARGSRGTGSCGSTRRPSCRCAPSRLTSPTRRGRCGT
jgi:hypothetical protein